MHHYLINGFTKITDELLGNKTVKELKKTEVYNDYKVIERKVLKIENALIYDLQDKLLNKISGKWAWTYVRKLREN